MITTDVAILGGGAAGLAAACACVKAGVSVTILEKNTRVGKKLLQTGNGRCNLTNTDINISHYHGDLPFITQVLARFGYEQCEAFFAELGLTIKADGEGRVYPRSEQAASVMTLLRAYAMRGDYNELCGFSLQDAKKTRQGFILRGENETVSSKRLIVSAGSMASADHAGQGYQILKQFGHKDTPIFPSLNAVKADALKGLKGIRSSASVRLLADGETVLARTGEVQFGYGTLSGICMFDLSRPIGEYFTSHTVNGVSCRNLSVTLDLAEEYTEETLKKLLFQQHGLYEHV